MKQLNDIPTQSGDILTLRYRIRNSSQERPLENVRLRSRLPVGLEEIELPPGFAFDGRTVEAALGTMEAGFSDIFEMRFIAGDEYFSVDQMRFEVGSDRQVSVATFGSDSRNPLTNLRFTLQNYAVVLGDNDFLPNLAVTFIYTPVRCLGSAILRAYGSPVGA